MLGAVLLLAPNYDKINKKIKKNKKGDVIKICREQFGQVLCNSS